MKHIQTSYLTGYVTILVEGPQPELFFQACIEEGIVIWNIKKVTDQTCEGNIKNKDIKVIKKVRRKTKYKIKFINKKGYPFLYKQLIKRKEIILSILLSFMLILFLANTLWKVTITGVSKEMEEKINEQLMNYGVHAGSLIFLLDSPNTIQQKLTNDLPELLWVGVHKKGTTFYLEGVEKTIVKKEEIIEPRHLVATKKGVIKSIFVSEGFPMVSVNDFVEAGDILVSGIIHNENVSSEQDDEESGRLTKKVAAQARITAQTWYNISISIPLKIKQELLTGNQVKKSYLKWGKVQLPIWGFKTPKYENVKQETHTKPLYLLKWKLPISKVETSLSEKVDYERVQTKDEAIENGIKQAKHDLLIKLGPEAKIISEKILHETIENGKVNLTLYITVEEDIIKAEPLPQGD